MRDLWGPAFVVGTMLLAFPAQACPTLSPIDLSDIEHADAVVIGQIRNYEIVLDEEARQRRQRQLANSPNMAPAVREVLENQTVFLSDYARFEVEVDEVLYGNPSSTILVTWNNSTFGEPTSTPAGQLLIALYDTGSSRPEDGSWAVLQSPCAPPFIFDADSEQARAIRQDYE